MARISPENPTVRSVACLAGSLAALPFSAEYDAFVREPTGVIERQTGHPVYRTDVSAPIDGGDSWQLGLFLAHMLKRDGLLAEGDEPADLDLLVTGRLDRDLNVGAVDHIEEKLTRAGAAGAARGLFVLPETGVVPEPSGGWSILPVKHPEQALAACLGSETTERLYGSLRQAHLGRRRPAWTPIRVAVVAGISAAMLLVMSLYFSVVRLPETIRQPDDDDAGSMMKVEIVPREKRGCGVPVTVPPHVQVFAGAACAAIVTVHRNGEFRISASLSGGFLSYVDAARYRRELHRVAAGGDRLELRIDFPYWVRRPVHLNVDVRQLAMDGRPVQSAGRNIELRPGTSLDP
ncbi:hypothetical protein [Nisaea sp.]|uniref:hypothetical protein n=1 Tax=Nisaea sp. TaxID=2024842 RepID=UPI003B5283C8